jgi:orotidine-5'-phosphate decarboxylase
MPWPYRLPNRQSWRIVYNTAALAGSLKRNTVHNAQSKILVALDVPTIEEALALVRQLRGRVGGFKIGLELCHSAGTPQAIAAISEAGGAVFADVKLKDIPNTVAGATRALCKPGVLMLNLHCDGGLAMLRAAANARDASAHRPLLLGVTVLTSAGERELREAGVGGGVGDQVLRLAQLAREAGLDGVVASPHEVAAIKRACGDDFLCVAPGVRPAWAAAGDQQRTLAPAEALAAGADYLVIGRPITAPPPGVGGPAEAAERILQELGS